MLRGAKASIEVLRSDEGRALRQRHGDNVRYLRDRLFEAGVAAVHTPSHIIPIHVREFNFVLYILLGLTFEPFIFQEPKITQRSPFVGFY